MIYFVFLQYIAHLYSKLSTSFFHNSETIEMQLFVGGADNPVYFSFREKATKWQGSYERTPESATETFTFTAPNGLCISFLFCTFHTKATVHIQQPEKAQLRQRVRINEIRMDKTDCQTIFKLEPDEDYPEITLKIYA